MRSQMKHMPGLPMPRLGMTGHLLVTTALPIHVNGRRPVGVGKIVELVGEVDRQRADRAADIVIFFEA